MLALTNFDDIISNVNINEAMHLLFDGINKAFKLCCPIRTKTLLTKTQLNHGFQVRFVQISRKGNIIHLLDKIKCPINSKHDLEILSQIKFGKLK